MSESTSDVIQMCKDVLERHYGHRLKDLILFGSVVRRQMDKDSDVDLLVVLDEPFDYSLELRQIIDLLYPVQLESDLLISAKPAPRRDFELGRLQLYRNVKRDGLIL